jgi:group I intron endonuclease
MATSGVYRLLNTRTKKFYIGSSENIELRFQQHEDDLTLGIHYNKYLLAAWRKSHRSEWRFEVIEKCRPDVRLRKEQTWIDRYWDSGQLYNLKRSTGYSPQRYQSKKKPVRFSLNWLTSIIDKIVG